MSDGVLIALLGTFGVVITALLSWLGVVMTSTQRHAKAARNEVQNNHDTNLRDDLDAQFEGLAGLVKGAIADIGGIKGDIRTIHQGQLEDRRDLARERDRINDIEKTIPRAPRPARPPRKPFAPKE